MGATETNASTTLECVYEVGSIQVRGEPRPVITIRRKPSQIPESIDRRLTRIAGSAHMNGPENYVMYEFLLPERFGEGEAVLIGYGWKRTEVKSERA